MVGHHSSMISEECRNQVIFITTCCYIKLEFLRPLEREENSLFFSFPGKTTTTTWSITALNCPPVTLDSQEQFQTMPARKSLRLPTSSNDIGSRVSSFLGESGRVNHSLISFIPNNDDIKTWRHIYTIDTNWEEFHMSPGWWICMSSRICYDGFTFVLSRFFDLPLKSLVATLWISANGRVACSSWSSLSINHWMNYDYLDCDALLHISLLQRIINN